jgi:hypothetical protein
MQARGLAFWPCTELGRVDETDTQISQETLGNRENPSVFWVRVSSNPPIYVQAYTGQLTRARLVPTRGCRRFKS